jgi:histone H3/H4
MSSTTAPKRRSRSSASKKDGKSKRSKSSSNRKRKERKDSKKDRKSGKKAKHARSGAADKPESQKEEKVSARNTEVKWTGRAKWGVRTQPFRRLVQMYAHQKFDGMRMASNVARAVQAAVEEDMVEILRQAARFTIHSKRTTVNKEDVELCTRISNPNSMDLKEAVEALVAKREKKKKQNPNQAPRTTSKRAPPKARVAGDKPARKGGKAKSGASDATGSAGTSGSGGNAASEASIPVSVAA